MTELRKCACGGEAQVVNHGRMVTLSCAQFINTACPHSTAFYDTEAEAIAAWNGARQDDRLERLRKWVYCNTKCPATLFDSKSIVIVDELNTEIDKLLAESPQPINDTLHEKLAPQPALPLPQEVAAAIAAEVKARELEAALLAERVHDATLDRAEKAEKERDAYRDQVRELGGQRESAETKLSQRAKAAERERDNAKQDVLAERTYRIAAEKREGERDAAVRDLSDRLANSQITASQFVKERDDAKKERDAITTKYEAAKEDLRKHIATAELECDAAAVATKAYRELAYGRDNLIKQLKDRVQSRDETIGVLLERLAQRGEQ